MLIDETLVAFLTTAKPRAAQAFYEGVLGLTFVIESEHMMVFESGAAKVTLQKGEAASVRPGTVLGWHVGDLSATVRTLMARGVVFQRYDLDQDDLGIWSPVPGPGVAWFLDPDGNTLSVSSQI